MTCGDQKKAKYQFMLESGQLAEPEERNVQTPLHLPDGREDSHDFQHLNLKPLGPLVKCYIV